MKTQPKRHQQHRNAIAEQNNGTTKAENHNSHRLGHDIRNNTFDIEKTLVNLSSDLFLMHNRFCCISLCERKVRGCFRGGFTLMTTLGHVDSSNYHEKVL